MTFPFTIFLKLKNRTLRMQFFSPLKQIKQSCRLLHIK